MEERVGIDRGPCVNHGGEHRKTQSSVKIDFTPRCLSWKLVPWPGLPATHSAWCPGQLRELWAQAVCGLLASEMWCEESTSTIRGTSLVVFPGRTSAGWSLASFQYTCWTSLGQGLPPLYWGGRGVKRPSCQLYAPSFWVAGRTGVIWTILVGRILVYFMCVIIWRKTMCASIVIGRRITN